MAESALSRLTGFMEGFIHEKKPQSLQMGLGGPFVLKALGEYISHQRKKKLETDILDRSKQVPKHTDG